MANKSPYQQPLNDLYAAYHSGREGLSTAQANQNREQFGKNQLAQKKKKPVWMIFLEQFKDFLVIILIIAAIISAITGELESTIVILVVITMNAILGTVQTVKAEKSLDNLKSLSAPHAKVLRDGTTVLLPAAELVVGDVILLEAGDQVPADARILEAASLQTNESALTGESTNVEKECCEIPQEVPLGDRKNMVYSGGFVTYGRGVCLVTNVGMETEVGKIAALMQNASERRTPLQRTLDQFGQKLSIAILVISAIVFLLELFRVDVLNFDSIMNALMFAIALAVAAIPEALSSIVTIVLSFGTQKMAKEHAIMRKLQAVEGLGSVSVICSDKTGTLTQNKMTVRKIVAHGHSVAEEDVNLENDDEKWLIIASVLCSDATCQGETEIGDPTETALIRFSQKNGMQAEDLRSQYPRLAEIPFDSDRKLMSTLNQTPQGKILFTKGAADVLTERMLITTEEKEKIHKQVEALSKQGLRLLCFAGKPFDGDTISLEDETDLQYMGLIAMMDPPRPESAEAVAACKAAGIKPVMITGDHVVTAAAIAKEIGILEQETEAVEGSALDAYTDEQLVDFVKDKSVYARVTPEHKIRIVRAWQARNCMVAMTGDGVNDAPALKQADVGVAMGITGTEVSKDAAAMVLTDDNFATIVKAIENGRNLYENIKRAILFLLSGNLAGILVVLACALAGLGQPFAAIHLLFINLLTDSLPAIGLGLEPHQASVMRKKPRPANESILTKPFLISVGYSGLIIGIMTFLAYVLGRSEGGDYLGMTMAFATLCMSRLWHGFSCKSEEPVLFRKQMINNPFGLMAFFAGMILINAVLLVPPLKSLFSIASLTGLQYAWIHIFSFGSMILIQIVKFVKSVVQRSAS
ncbi:MAG: cation-translocating P-type ATPase [Ruminococcus sp.]|jgi:Ca2+-transporting ATPase|nr:cation-translocating P-type ATPase [Ruminococcus sp.]